LEGKTSAVDRPRGKCPSLYDGKVIQWTGKQTTAIPTSDG